MKKVLALVLAVIMVCTMAMAATVSSAIGTSGSAGVTPSTTKYDIVPGGTNYYVALTDKNLYFKDDKFVPEKNKIGIDYAAGSDLVASAGWVKIAKANQDLTKGIVSGSKDDVAYQYQIVLKNDFTRVADGKSFDFSISKITLNATGWELQTVWEADEAAGDVIKADVGYEVVDIDVAVSSAGVTTFDAVPGKINKIVSIVKNGTTPLESATLKIIGNSTTATGKTYAKGTLNKGAAFYVVKAADMPEFADADLAKTGTLSPAVAKIVNNNNLPMAGVLEQTDVNAAKLYKVYAKGIDGKVSSVAATLDNGVLKFNVPALSTVIVTTDVLTVTGTASTGTTTGTTGTTTNPGTGANDVVGVAAALAVVALVSGAAISLKK